MFGKLAVAKYISQHDWILLHLTIWIFNMEEKIAYKNFLKGRIFKVKGLGNEVRLNQIDLNLELVSFILNGEEIWIEFDYLIGAPITENTFSYFKNISCEEGNIFLLDKRGKPFLSLILKSDGYYYFEFVLENKTKESYKLKFWFTHQMQLFYHDMTNFELI